MIQYACTFVTKEVAEDAFEAGTSGVERCVICQAYHHLVDLSLPALFHKIGSFFGFEVAWLMDANVRPATHSPPEALVIEYCRTENGNGDPPTEADRETWAAGTVVMYAARWAFHVQKQEVGPFPIEELHAAGVPQTM